MVLDVRDRYAMRDEQDLLVVLAIVRKLLRAAHWSPMDEQMVIVSASELCRNIIVHAHGQGDFSCKELPYGVEIMAKDRGPGIPDVLQALRAAGKSTHGLGLGLAGVNRLMDEMLVETSCEGTMIIARKSKPTHKR
ncbi:MAG: ATP-binding protein [Firmicutes bacterium]|nr:ATP-binding protein [Bacillota bacterium]